MTLYTGDPGTARGSVFPSTLDEQPTSFETRTRAVGASIEEGFAQTSEALVSAGIQRRFNAGGATLSRQEAEARAKSAGVTISGLGESISEGALDVLIANQERAKRRQEIMEAADMPGVVRFAGNFVGGLPDPINLVGLPFAAGAKTVGGAIVRGVAANMATAALVEPGYYMLNRYAGNEYDGWDSLTNIGFAGVIGGVSTGALKMFDHPRVDVEMRKAALAQVARDQDVRMPAERDWYTEVLEGDRGEGFNIDAYHGTNADFKQFDLQRGGVNTNARDAQGAMYFSDNPDVASGYAKFAGKAEEAFVSGRKFHITKTATTGVYDITDSSGKSVGELDLKYFPGTKDIFVNAVYGKSEVPGSSGGDRAINMFGPSAMRDLLSQLKEEFPNATTISGQRISGSRGEALGLIHSESDDAPHVQVKISDFLKTPEKTATGANVLPVRLKIANPLVVDMKGAPYSQTKFQIATLEAKQQGRDGVIFKNVNDDVSAKDVETPGALSTVYATFDTNQIRGKFGGLDTAGPTARELAERRSGGLLDGREAQAELATIDRVQAEAAAPKPAKGTATENPEVTELTKLTNDDVQVAKQVEEAKAAKMPDEEGAEPESELDEALAALKEEEAEVNRFTKGIEAGLNCYLRKGVE